MHIKHIHSILNNLSLLSKKVFTICACFSCLNACKEIDKKDTEPITSVVETPVVLASSDITILSRQPFVEETWANGKLSAKEKNILKFNVSGTLQKLSVQNGDKVQKGEVLAQIDPFNYRQTYLRTKTTLARARLDFEDMLVGRGYDLNQKDSIPVGILEMASIRSGLDQAEHEMATAEFELKSTTLRAPFTGKIANIHFKQFEQVNSGEVFMTLINDFIFEAQFYLIESELDKIDLGKTVRIEALDHEYEGKIISINPVVDTNGTVLVKASVKNDGRLLEGMNIKVKILSEISNQFVVPKNSILLRQNQQLVFKLENGRTFWTYIKSQHENSSSFAIIPDPERKNTASLSEGDTIITSNNLNLAHDVKVIIK